MITFTQYLNEGKFRDSASLEHIMDVPMFSVFVEVGMPEVNPTIWFDVEEAFKMARNHIIKMGFPSMHVNAVFKKYANTERKVLGKAHGNPEAAPKHKSLKHISLSRKYLAELEHNYNKGFPQLVDTIVHEWGHIWMFNNGQAFRNAVKQYHEALVNSNIDKIPMNYGDPIKIFKKIYDHLIYNTLPKLSGRPKKITVVQDNVNNILLDRLNDFGMYALAIDADMIKSYANDIGKILVTNSNNPSEAYKQIRALNMEREFGNVVKHETQRSMAKSPAIRQQLSDMVKFTGSYGLKDPDETWATALQSFNTLDPYHRKRIFELMQTTGFRRDANSRIEPNARSKKYIKQKQREYLKNVTLDDLK